MNIWALLLLTSCCCMCCWDNDMGMTSSLLCIAVAPPLSRVRANKLIVASVQNASIKGYAINQWPTQSPWNPMFDWLHHKKGCALTDASPDSNTNRILTNVILSPFSELSRHLVLFILVVLLLFIPTFTSTAWNRSILFLVSLLKRWVHGDRQWTRERLSTPDTSDTLSPHPRPPHPHFHPQSHFEW